MKISFRKIIAFLFISSVAIWAFFTYNYLVEKFEHYFYPRPYSDIVSYYSDEFGVPESVIYAVMRTESFFAVDATSSKGAAGLMQITDDTFTWLQSKTGASIDSSELYNPKINICYGTFFLGMLYEEFGSWNTAYAAYNAGRARVKGWLEDPAITEKGVLINIPLNEPEQNQD